MRRWTFTCLFMLLLTSPAMAQLSFEQMAQLTDSPAQLSGTFSQQKYLSEFEAVINSSGEFNYQRDESIEWNTLKPIANELVLTPQGLTSKQGGQLLNALKADENQVVKLINEIFFAVLTAQWEDLAVFFDLTGREQAGHWQVTLTPKQATLKHALKQIELSGERLLTEAKMIEMNGDYTHILFENLQQ